MLMNPNDPRMRQFQQTNLRGMMPMMPMNNRSVKLTGQEYRGMMPTNPMQMPRMGIPMKIQPMALNNMQRMNLQRRM